MSKYLQDEQQRSWERMQERLPGGPGDPCLDCPEEIECNKCKHYKGPRSSRAGEPENFYLDEED